MKRVITYGLSLALVFSLAACTSPKDEPQEDTNTTPAVTEPADTSTPEQDGGEYAELDTVEGVGLTGQEVEDTTNLFVDDFAGVYVLETVPVWDNFNDSKVEIGTMEKGAFIPRLAVGTGEAEGWSQISFDNDIGFAYIPSEYISTEEPVTEQPVTEQPLTEQPQQTPASKPSTGNTQTNKPSGNQGSSSGQSSSQTGGNTSSGGAPVPPGAGGSGSTTDDDFDTSDEELLAWAKEQEAQGNGGPAENFDHGFDAPITN